MNLRPFLLYVNLFFALTVSNAYKITSFKSGNIHNKFNYKHAKLEEIALANKWKHPTDQYDNGDQFVKENNLDNGINKDEEIKALKEEIKMLKNN
jgi:hypothetical protein